MTSTPSIDRKLRANFASFATGLALLLCFSPRAEGQSCANGPYKTKDVRAVSTLYHSVLVGFDQKTSPAAGQPFKKYLEETWSGTFECNNPANTYPQNGSAGKDFLLNYTGAWTFKPDGTSSSTKSIVDQNGNEITYGGPGTYAPVVPPYTEIDNMESNLDAQIRQTFLGYAGYSVINTAPVIAAITTPSETTTTFNINGYVMPAGIDAALNTPAWGDGSILKASVVETLSSEYTPDQASQAASPMTGNSPSATFSNYSRSWIGPAPGFVGNTTFVTQDTAPVTFDKQSFTFYVRFPSGKEPKALAPDVYDVTYYLKQTSNGVVKELEVAGGRISFKGTAFYAPAGSGDGVPPGPNAQIPIQFPATPGTTIVFDYATATPAHACPCGANTGGTGSGKLDSVHFSISLGNLSDGSSAGKLEMLAPSVSKLLYTTAAWNAVVPTSNDITLVEDTSGNLLQVKTTYWLVDLLQVSASVCDVNIYQAGQISGIPAANQRFPLSGSPFVTFESAEPTADSGAGSQLTVSEIRGSMVKQTSFSNFTSSVGPGVTMSLGPGYGVHRISQGTSGTTITEVRDTLNDSGSLLDQTTTVYNVANFGTVVTSMTVSTGSGAPLVTQNTYYNNSATDGAAYGNLKQSINPDGSWDYYTYDSFGRLAQHLSPYLNSAPTIDPTQCRATTVTYITLADLDGDGLQETLVQTVNSVLGAEVSRSYEYRPTNTVMFNGDPCQQVSSIKCIKSGAAWNDSGNLATLTYTYRGGPFDGQTRAIFYPDGTASLTAMALDGQGNSISTVKTGQLNAAGTDVVVGTMDVTTTNLTSNSAVGVTTSDIATASQLSYWTATQSDQWGRPTTIAYSDGTTDYRSYACCGLASETDREGITTSYNYDLAGRLVSTTRAGVTTLNGYDADGRLLTVTRQGSDGSAIVQQTNSYDLAGRKISSADAMGRITTYSQKIDSSNESVVTTTDPDGGTQVATNASDGSPLSVSGTSCSNLQYSYGVDSIGYFTKTIHVGSSGETTEWTKSYSDFAGRSSSTAYADGASSNNTYNRLGQLIQTIDPDGVSMLYGYDSLGHQTTVVTDMDRNGTIDASGTDRITSTVTQVASDHGTVVQQTTTTVWSFDNSPSTEIVSISETSADGLQSWQTTNGLTTSTQVAYGGAGARTETTIAPDGVHTVSQYQNDLLISKTISQASVGTLSGSTYGYDPHGRLSSSTDQRNGPTTYSYYGDDRIRSTTTPDPDPAKSGPGYDPQTTGYDYDMGGRLWHLTQPDGTVVTSVYFPTGLLQSVSGSRTYHQEYTYDSQGRVKTLSTWQNYSTNTGEAVTAWNYDAQRGWLVSKSYPDNNGPSYTYWPSGRLKTRTWARGIQTTYLYNNAGDVANVSYSDSSTPAVSLTYNRRGQLLTVADAAGTCTYAYDRSGQLQSESYGATGLLASNTINRSFDSLDRMAGISLGSAYSVNYGYGAGSRLMTVTNGAEVATYAYLPNSNLIGSLTFQNAGGTKLATNLGHDFLARTSSLTSAPSGAGPISQSYTYNQANQRITVTREDGSYWQFGYDALGQVTSANKSLSSGAQVSGYEFSANYDEIGNRSSTTVNNQPFTYAANILNQYSNRTVPGIYDVIGTANPNALVTVNYQQAQRQGPFFYEGLSVDNSAIPQFKQVNIAAVISNAGPAGQDAVMQATRSLFVPASPESFTYDLDGNLLSDGRWAYTWDGENHLIAMQTTPAAIAAGAPNQKLTFAYDSQGRRIQKTVSNWSNGSYVPVSDVRFVNDGWNLLAEYDALHGGNLIRSYVWGLDLSGSLQGAGGVGGLLEFYDYSYAANYFIISDANGNVTGLVDASSGSVGAQYEYGSFGETLRTSAIAANTNPFGFSTKYTDVETERVYYGQRYYIPGTGRWLSRDSTEESGGNNLYGFVDNSPISSIDDLGDSPISIDQIKDQFFPWRDTNNSISIDFGTCVTNDILNQIYLDLRRFNHFPPNRGGSVIVEGSVAKFSAPGALKLIQRTASHLPFIDTSYYNVVDLTFDDSNHIVTGVTQPGHILDGVRHWQVQTSNYNPDIVRVNTNAHERSSNALVEVFRLVDFQHLQDDVWVDYLQNIGEYWASTKNAKIISQ
jgi:RHS repeat-associated protein